MKKFIHIYNPQNALTLDLIHHPSSMGVKTIIVLLLWEV